MAILVLMLLLPVETGPMPREVPTPAEARKGNQDVNPAEARKPPPAGYDPVEVTNDKGGKSDRLGLMIGAGIGVLAGFAFIAWRNRRKPTTP